MTTKRGLFGSVSSTEEGDGKTAIAAVNVPVASSSTVNDDGAIATPPAKKKFKTSHSDDSRSSSRINNPAVFSSGGSSTTTISGGAGVSSSYDDAYDSDEEPPPPDPNEHLNWRLDPNESHSDWKIEIIVTTFSESLESSSSSSSSNDDGKKKDDGTNNGKQNRSRIDVYHIHRHMVAVGSKKCEYFSRLFKSSFFEASNSTSRIELDETAANAFPIFLDYMYCPLEQELKITTENATALHYLGKYFENRRLRWLVKRFVSNDISIETCSIYYAYAKSFHDDKILHAVATFCREHIDSITPENPLLKSVDLDFMMKLVGPNLSTTTSKHLSTIIARFCLDNGDILTPESFQELTNNTTLPTIDYRAAVELMAAENRLNRQGGKDGSETLHENLLSNLQERCSEALTSHISAVDFTSSRSKMCMNEINSRILVGVLSSAQHEIQVLQRENKRLMTVNHSHEVKIEKLKQETQSRKTTNEIFVAQNRTLNNEIRSLTEENKDLLTDIQGLIPVPADGNVISLFQGKQGNDDKRKLIDSTFDQQDGSTMSPPPPKQEEVQSVPAFDRNRSLKRQIFYQSKSFTNILGEKEPAKCYPIYYFKKGG